MSGSSRGGKDEMDSGAMATSSSAPALSKVMRRERVQIVGHVEEAGVDHPSSISGGATVCDVLICTPGRLVDHLTATPGFTLQHLRWLIIDEADRLLNQTFDGWLDKTLASAHGETVMASSDGNALPTGLMSFRDDPLDLVNLPTFCPVMSLNRNIHGPPTHLQKLLFSATLTRNPGKIASLRLVRPRYIAAAAQDGTINVDTTSALVASHTNESTTTSADQPTQQRYILPASLTQYACVCADPSEKPLYLLMLMYRYNVRSTLCFTKSVESTERLCAILKQFAEQYPLNGRFGEHKWDDVHHGDNTSYDCTATDSLSSCHYAPH